MADKQQQWLSDLFLVHISGLHFSSWPQALSDNAFVDDREEWMQMRGTPRGRGPLSSVVGISQRARRARRGGQGSEGGWLLFISVHHVTSDEAVRTRRERGCSIAQRFGNATGCGAANDVRVHA